MLPEGEVEERVPVLSDPGGHGLLFGAALAGHVRRFGVAGPVGQPLQELVGGDLRVFGDERVAGVLHALVGAQDVAYALDLGRGDGGKVLGGAREAGPPTQRRAPDTQALELASGLLLVPLEYARELRVAGVQDQGIELEQDVLLQGVDVLYVVGQLLPEGITFCHVVSLQRLRSSALPDPAHPESAKHAPAEHGASDPRTPGGGTYLIDDGRKREPVDQREAVWAPLDIEGPADQGADAGLAPRALDALPDAEHRRQEPSRTLDPPGAFELQPSPTTRVVGRGITSSWESRPRAVVYVLIAIRHWVLVGQGPSMLTYSDDSPREGFSALPAVSSGVLVRRTLEKVAGGEQGLEVVDDGFVDHLDGGQGGDAGRVGRD